MAHSHNETWLEAGSQFYILWSAIIQLPLQAVRQALVIGDRQQPHCTNVPMFPFGADIVITKPVCEAPARHQHVNQSKLDDCTHQSTYPIGPSLSKSLAIELPLLSGPRRRHRPPTHCTSPPPRYTSPWLSVPPAAPKPRPRTSSTPALSVQRPRAPRTWRNVPDPP